MVQNDHFSFYSDILGGFFIRVFSSIIFQAAFVEIFDFFFGMKHTQLEIAAAGGTLGIRDWCSL